MTDSFAIGAEPIFGEDVFGYTIAIDASGRYTFEYDPAADCSGDEEYGTGGLNSFVIL